MSFRGRGSTEICTVHISHFNFAILVIIYSRDQLTALDGFVIQAESTQDSKVLGYFTAPKTGVNYMNCASQNVSPEYHR